jgi:hypothetical protein
MKKLSWLAVFVLAVTVINYPNPFNPQGGEVATFEATANSRLTASLYIYDMSARVVRKQAFNLQAGAANRTTWDGFSHGNDRVGNGVYLYRLVDAASKSTLAKGKIWVINH